MSSGSYFIILTSMIHTRETESTSVILILEEEVTEIVLEAHLDSSKLGAS